MKEDNYYYIVCYINLLSIYNYFQLRVLFKLNRRSIVIKLLYKRTLVIFEVIIY